MTNSDTLVLYDLPALEAKAQDLTKEVEGSSQALSVAAFTPNAAAPVKKVIVLFSSATHADKALEACFAALGPKGELVVKLCGEEGGEGSLKTQLLLAGFVNVEALPASATSSASLIAHKPQWEVGAVAQVSLPSAKAWKLVDTEEEDLIDPDSLLDEGLLAAAKEKKEKEGENGGGCETKKRACKNCSCGRAEMEAAGEGRAPTVTDEELKASVSSCGNCYKGDAFRCGGCPFLGKPAFEPGQEKVVLSLGEADL